VTQPAVQEGSPNTRYLQFSALIAASIAIWWRPLLATAHLALSSDAHTHILLVVPISLALIYLACRGSVPEARRSPSGIYLLAIALLLRLFVMWSALPLSTNDRVSLSMFGLVVSWLGSVLVCFGMETLRSLLFPLCFLVLVVPYPDRVLTGVVEFLQNSSAWATEFLFRLAHVPVTRDGILLSIPGLDIEVAQECSSIRSSMMLLLITLVLAHVFLNSWWRKILLVLAVVPLSVVKNAIRIFTIGELGTRVDPSYLDGRLHRNGGIVFLSFAVLAVILLLWVLRRREVADAQG